MLLVVLLCAAGLLDGAEPVGAHSVRAVQADPSRRVTERLAALRREAAELDAREKTLLTELRRLEIDRQIKAEELAALERTLRETQDQMAATGARAAQLRQAASATRPEVEERLVRLYKMGRAGHWRLLLDVDDLRATARAYRTAAALTALDRERIQAHQVTLQTLDMERAALDRKAREVAALQQRAQGARAALDRAVGARAALLRSIDERQDLTARLADELMVAQQRLEAAVGAGHPAAAVVPLRPFKGDLPWPAEGIVVGRFGRHRNPRTGADVTRNGVELSIGEGRSVTAVHDGVVSYSAPFSGYGHLVIVEHGTGAHSLYGHLASGIVNKGDRVQPGTRVGISGRNPAGNPALYFELRIDGKPVDPLQWLRKQP